MSLVQNHAAILPEDILLTIFELGVKLDTRLALKLTHTCRHWRSICLASPFLWSHIFVVNDYDTLPISPTIRLDMLSDIGTPIDKSPPDFRHFQHHLSQSKAMLLDVTVDIRMATYEEGDYEVNNSFEKLKVLRYQCRSHLLAGLLASHSHRIRSLKVTSDTYGGISLFFDALQRMSTTSAAVAIKLGAPWDTGRAVTGDKPWVHLEHCQFNWTGSLEAFEELPPSLLDRFAVALFEGTKSRVTYSSGSIMQYGSDHTTSTFPATPVLLPRLRKISICGLSVNWDCFAPANLEELELADMHDMIKPTLCQLRAVLLANQATLKTLSLINGCAYFEEDAAENPLEFTLPMVDTLNLGYVYSGDLHSFACLARLPALTNLNIRNMRDQVHLDEPISPHELHHLESTSILFSKMTFSWPLHNLDSITLENVRFLSDEYIYVLPNPVVDLEEVEEWLGELDGGMVDLCNGEPVNMYDLVKSLLPIDFCQSCTSLRELTLIKPDAATLYALSCPAPPIPYLYKDGHDQNKTQDYGDGSWIELPGGRSKFLRIPVPKLQKLSLLAVMREDECTFIQRRRILFKKAVGKRGT